MQRLVPVLAAVVTVVGSAADPGKVTAWLDAYDDRHQTGNMITYQDSASSLGGWNDIMRSACLNGFWVFFEHDQFNYQAGGVLWAYGFEYCFTFLLSFDRKVSSVRRVGDYSDAAAASLTLYDGTQFSGNQVFTNKDQYNVTAKYGYQSVIVSGPDAWTIYSGDNYRGTGLCLYSGSDNATSPTGQTLQYGLFPSPDYLGVIGGDIRSVRRGCSSRLRAWGEPLGRENRLTDFGGEEEKSRQGAAGEH